MKQLVIPPNLRQHVLKSLHDDVGHVGRDKTLDLIQSRFYWPGLMNYITGDKVKNCHNCVCRKTGADQAPIVPIISTQPSELVCLDYLSLEPS